MAAREGCSQVLLIQRGKPHCGFPLIFHPSGSKFRTTLLRCLETFDDQESSCRNDSEFCSAQITSIGILKRRAEFQEELPKAAGGRFFLRGVQVFRREQKLHANTGIGMRETFV